MLLRCPVIAVQLGAQQLSGLIAADEWRAGYATVSLALPFGRAGDDDHVPPAVRYLYTFFGQG